MFNSALDKMIVSSLFEGLTCLLSSVYICVSCMSSAVCFGILSITLALAFRPLFFSINVISKLKQLFKTYSPLYAQLTNNLWITFTDTMVPVSLCKRFLMCTDKEDLALFLCCRGENTTPSWGESHCLFTPLRMSVVTKNSFMGEPILVFTPKLLKVDSCRMKNYVNSPCVGCLESFFK